MGIQSGQGIKSYEVDYKTEEPSISFWLFRFTPLQTGVFTSYGLPLLHMSQLICYLKKKTAFVWRYDPVTVIKYAFIQKKFFMTLS